MGLVRAHPFLHGLSFFIRDGQLRSRQLLSIRDVLLGNLNLDQLILHLHLLDFRRVGHGKCNRLRPRKSGRGCHLGQDIISQTERGFMRLFCGVPLVNDLPVLVRDSHMSARQFLSGCDVLLGDLNHQRRVQHLHSLHRQVILHLKRDGLRRSILIRRRGLGQCVGPHLQIDDMFLLRRNPLLDDISLKVCQAQMRPGQFLLTRHGLLGKMNLQFLVIHGDTLDLQ